jgi:hypothetical protein
VRLSEIKKPVDENIEDDLKLTARQYRKIISDLKKQQVGDRRATQALKQIEAMWSKQDKLVGNYKSIIKDFDIDL